MEAGLHLKQSVDRPGCIRLLDQAERLVPDSYEIVDEALSNGYLRLFPADRDQSRIVAVIQIALAVQFSCVRALLHSLLVFVAIYRHAAGSAESSYPPCKGAAAVIRYAIDRGRDLLQLLRNAVGELHDVVDRDADGCIGFSDVGRCAASVLWHAGRCLAVIVGIAWRHVLIALRRLLDVILPPPPSPSSMKPQAQFHQNSPNHIAEAVLERFQRRRSGSLSLATIAKVLYARLAQRCASWCRLAVSGIWTLWALLLQLAASMMDAICSMIKRHADHKDGSDSVSSFS